jgi:hypothetical protein
MIDMSSEIRYSVLSEKSESAWSPENAVSKPSGETSSPEQSSSFSHNKKSTQSSKSNQSSSIFQRNSSLKSQEHHQKQTSSILNEFELANAVKDDSDMRNVELIVVNGPDPATDETNEPSSPRTNLDEQYLFPGNNAGINLQNVPNHAFKTANDSESKRVKPPSTKKVLTEHFILILIISLILLVILLLLILMGMNRKLTMVMSEQNRTCTSDRCILVSSSIYNSLNRQADPCEDFYEYACGRFIKNTLIPAGFPRWGTLNLIAYENQLLIKDQMESNSTELTEAEVKARTFYKSCIDAKGLIETLGAKPLLNILAKVVYKNTTTNTLVVNETFENLLSMIQITYGLNTIFEFNVLDDDKNSSYSNIEVTFLKV